MHKDQVTIKTPCNVEWNTLERRRTGRFCHHCNQLVFDLSSMTRDQAKGVLDAATQAVCVRYLHDATGEIHFADSAQVVQVSRLARSARAAALTLAPMLIQACGGADMEDYRSDYCTPSSSDTARSPASNNADAGAPTTEEGVPCPEPEYSFPDPYAVPPPPVAPSSVSSEAPSLPSSEALGESLIQDE
jgi:hypothetical protein